MSNYSAEGFNPERIRALKIGMETTLGSRIRAAAIFDRDYRSEAECETVRDQCATFCDQIAIHKRKELENFLLVPPALDRAIERRQSDRFRRTGKKPEQVAPSAEVLDRFALERENDVEAQLIDSRRRFARSQSSGTHDTSLVKASLAEFKQRWRNVANRYEMIPGKEALSYLNNYLQDTLGLNITIPAIIDAMSSAEVPAEIQRLIENLAKFGALKPHQ